MNEQDRKISEIIAEERYRLRNFIRRRVPDPSDVEEILQEVFYELVEANTAALLSADQRGKFGAWQLPQKVWHLIAACGRC